MDSDEKRLKQEDCNEDGLGTGVLTLTNKRIAFDKRTSRIADFSTKMGETVIDVPLDQVDVWKEGRFIKKICIKIKNASFIFAPGYTLDSLIPVIAICEPQSPA